MSWKRKLKRLTCEKELVQHIHVSSCYWRIKLLYVLPTGFLRNLCHFVQEITDVKFWSNECEYERALFTLLLQPAVYRQWRHWSLETAGHKCLRNYVTSDKKFTNRTSNFPVSANNIYFLSKLVNNLCVYKTRVYWIMKKAGNGNMPMCHHCTTSQYNCCFHPSKAPHLLLNFVKFIQ